MKITRLTSVCLAAGVLTAVAASFLVLGTSGCASSSPAPLLIQQNIIANPARVLGDDARLRLVTYNVWGLPTWMTGASSGRYPRIALELKRLDPDVILLQEAWTADARKSAPADRQWTIARAAGQHSFFQQNGLVTLSKFPILDGRFYPFSRAAFPDSFVNKGILKVTVQLSGARVLNIWNVHLQDGALRVREQQVRELISRVRESTDGQVADLVGGDFNCTPDSALFRELEAQLGPSIQRLDGTKAFVTWDGLSSKSQDGQTLDHVFIRTRSSFCSLQASQHVAFTAPSLKQRLSDHFGIEALVRFYPSTVLGETSNPFRGFATPAITATRVALEAKD